ncbi:MAG: CBS domain-containing protein [Chloroflexota bacterium]
MKIILSHDNADFDAVASMLGVYKLHPDAIPILPKHQHRNVREFLTLYKNGLPFVLWDDFKDGKAVTLVTITDTARRLYVRDLRKDTPTTIIEHHPLKRELHPYETWAGEIVGAATTLLVEQIKAQQINLTSLEATLLALGIYADTGNFLYGGTTVRDIRAAAWLVEQGAVLDTVQKFLSNPLNKEQQDLLDTLMDDIDSRRINGFDVVICTASADSVIHSISTVVGVLRDILDADAIVVLVAMPEHVQLIARSTSDAIHVGQLASHFGGGGHPRASASAIHDAELEQTKQAVWEYLSSHIQPAKRIAHIMSFGDVQTVLADELIEDIITRIRRIGHEGYPVLDNEQVIGLLTLKDADKALEHGLKRATVREVMKSGTYSLSLDDAISLLEETMVNSDWGQIPIVDDTNQLIGIVTRTDLIKHWAQTHPDTQDELAPKIDIVQAQQLLGDATVTLIQHIADEAMKDNRYLYMVGGIVRDLLLNRANFDVDFVLEGDAIDFAEQLQVKFGGTVHAHPPFGTATWTLDETASIALDINLDAIPDHLDFATARSELYEHPTALPTVYNSGIKLDLRRRDFTINALAIQLSPEKRRWQLLDFYGGISDLDKQVIRVLHSLSFIDDPTRILRAVRFSERLGFTIETRTTELIATALPMLERITGERLQNEFNLILQEKSAMSALSKLESLDVLKAIHPKFELDDNLASTFERVDASDYPTWNIDSHLLKWHVLLGHLSEDIIGEIGERLLLRQAQIKAMQATSKLLQETDWLIQATIKPSEIVKRLENVSSETLVAVWLLSDDNLIHRRLEQFYTAWRHITPNINGNTLKDRGLRPSPKFREILERVRSAWIDGVIADEVQEQRLLNSIISEVYDERTD